MFLGLELQWDAVRPGTARSRYQHLERACKAGILGQGGVRRRQFGLFLFHFLNADWRRLPLFPVRSTRGVGTRGVDVRKPGSRPVGIHGPHFARPIFRSAKQPRGCIELILGARFSTSRLVAAMPAENPLDLVFQFERYFERGLFVQRAYRTHDRPTPQPAGMRKENLDQLEQMGPLCMGQVRRDYRCVPNRTLHVSFQTPQASPTR